MEVTQELVRRRFCYDPETGKLTVREKYAHNVQIGDEAGTQHIQGYRKITINNKAYLGHRIIWLYVHGKWPKKQIDHINLDRSDNRLCNLREASHAENLHNIKKQKNNTSGYKGVCFDKGKGKWLARIYVNSKPKHLGRFDTAEEAGAAYARAAKKIRGEFARY